MGRFGGFKTGLRECIGAACVVLNVLLPVGAGSRHDDDRVIRPSIGSSQTSSGN